MSRVSLPLPPTYPGGEIGRRAVFRRLCLRACWFESSSGYSITSPFGGVFLWTPLFRKMASSPMNLKGTPTFVPWSKVKTSERPHKANMPSHDVMANPWSLRALAVRKHKRKSWKLQGILHPVAGFTFCARDFGNLAQDPTALRVVVKWGLPGSWKHSERRACRP